MPIEEKIINGKLYRNEVKHRFKSKNKALKLKEKIKARGDYAQIFFRGGLYRVFIRKRGSVYIKKPYEKRKTPERQAERKLSGTKIEKTVAQHLLKILPKKYKLGEHNISEGIDLVMEDGRKLKVEVKSVLAQTFDKNQKGEAIARTGRFYIKRIDFEDSLFFAFVVKPVNEKLEWDKTKRVKIKYVLTKDLTNWLKAKGRFPRNVKKIIWKQIFSDELKPLNPATLVIKPI